ncbi:MAG: Beta-glucosidase [Thermotogales bacterium 46_20]|nr:MAG: Beta-glucosidase [Thermotogales bacterium 46_20]
MSVLGRNFLWGVSTSGHQIEGDNIFSDWYDWERAGGTINGDISGKACDSLNHLERDVAALKEVNVNCYRFSVEWARIEPRQHRFEREVLNNYRTFAKRLVQEGIIPIVTLHSFVNPKWFADLDGWEREDNTGYFRRYVEVVADSLGDLVKIWITINKPDTYARKSYSLGIWPPSVQDSGRARRTLRNLLVAHSQAYRTIKSRIPKAIVSLTQETPSYRLTFKDRLRRNFSPHVLSSREFYVFEGLCSGELKFTRSKIVLPEIKGTADFVGLDYNSAAAMSDKETSMEDPGSDLAQRGSQNAQYSKELETTIHKAAKGFRLPLFVTIEGTGILNDVERINCIETAVAVMNQAARRGIEIASFMYHPLMDCFEWNLGYSMQSGLFETNFETLELNPRESARKLEKIIKNHNRRYLLSAE